MKIVEKATNKGTKKFFNMTEEEFRTLSDEYHGVCLGCGELADGCEPDARAYTCEHCEENRVYGLEEALIMGRINIEE